MKNLLLAILTLCLFPIYAQETKTTLSTSVQATKMSQPEEDRFLSHLSVALRASTLGVGLQAATPITDHFKLRAGLDFFSLSPGEWSINLDDPNGVFEQAFGYTPDYSTKGKIQFVNGNVLVDYHPTKGIFHVTGGFFLGSNKISAKGQLVDNNGNPAKLKEGVTEWPYVDFDGHRLTMDDANLNADLRLGGIIKPYLGLGVGRAIAKNRVAFKFELGMIYQGNYALKQNGKTLKVVDNAIENFEDIDTYKKWLRWWPMLNFQLSYRIF